MPRLHRDRYLPAAHIVRDASRGVPASAGSTPSIGRMVDSIGAGRGSRRG